MGSQMSEFEFQTFLVPPPYLGHFPKIFAFLSYDASPKQIYHKSLASWGWLWAQAQLVLKVKSKEKLRVQIFLKFQGAKI